jgi:hypothetical protein
MMRGSLVGRFAALTALATASVASAQKLTKQEIKELGNAAGATIEAKANLKALFTAQKAIFQEKNKFGTAMGEIGFSPAPKNRYTYFLAPEGPAERRTAGFSAKPDAVIVGLDEAANPDKHFPPTLKSTGCTVTLPKGMNQLGVGLGEAAFQKSGKPGPAFVAVAAATLTSGPEFDCWSISNLDRETKGAWVEFSSAR